MSISSRTSRGIVSKTAVSSEAHKGIVIFFSLAVTLELYDFRPPERQEAKRSLLVQLRFITGAKIPKF